MVSKIDYNIVFALRSVAHSSSLFFTKLFISAVCVYGLYKHNQTVNQSLTMSDDTCWHILRIHLAAGHRAQADNEVL